LRVRCLANFPPHNMYRVLAVRITYREFCPVWVDGPQPGEYSVGRVAKVVLGNKFDGYKEEKRIS